MTDHGSFHEEFHPNGHNGIYRCDICHQYIPTGSLTEHFELKHSLNEDRYDDPALENPILSDLVSTVTEGPIKRDYLYSIDIANNDSAYADSTFIDSPYKNSITERYERGTNSRINLSSTPIPNNNQGRRHRRRHSIPSVFEMFNGPGTSMVFNDDATQRYGSTRRSLSVSRERPIGEVRCTICANFMHQDYIESHMKRCHQSKNHAALDGTLDIDKVDVKVIHKKSNNHYGIRAKKFVKNPEGFIRCKTCDSLMHVDYLPAHMLRKHMKEHVGAIGIGLAQFHEDQVNKWLNDRRIYFKDGGFFVNDSYQPRP